MVEILSVDAFLMEHHLFCKSINHARVIDKAFIHMIALNEKLF